MFSGKSMLFGVTCCVGLATSASAQEPACVPDPGRDTIKVSVGDDGKPVVTPDAVSVCEGESVRWVFAGSSAREFSVLFTGVANSPFDWSRQTGATVTGTVKAGAAKDGKKTEYKYDVDVDGKVLDPKIIVER